MKKLLILTAIITVSAAQAVVVDDFEHGNAGLYTNLNGGGAADVSGAHAHSGAFGFGGNGGDFYGRFDVVTNPGFLYTSMVRSTGGRVYVGVGATANSMWSAVLGLNTQEIMLQDNAGLSFNEFGHTAAPIVAGTWYQLDLDWAVNGDMQVSLYDAAGANLLAQTPVIATGFTTPGGLGLRTFGTGSVDTVQAVPEPATFIAIGVGLALVALRRRK